jgi:hypothetical protein
MNPNLRFPKLAFCLPKESGPDSCHGLGYSQAAEPRIVSCDSGLYCYNDTR